MTSIVEIPGVFYAKYDPDTQTIVGWGFMPAAGDAGYFGASAVWQDNADPRCDVSDDDSPFWHAVEAVFDHREPVIQVRWETDGWEVEEPLCSRCEEPARRHPFNPDCLPELGISCDEFTPHADIVIEPHPHTFVCPVCGLTRSFPDGWQAMFGTDRVLCTKDNVVMEER